MKLFNVLLKKELVTQLFGNGGKKKDILGKIVSGLISAVFLALFVFLYIAFQSKFAQLNLDKEVLILFMAVAVIAQTAFAVARVAHVLYGGVDAKVILPLPISDLTMLMAKLFSLWIQELINSLFFLIPVLLAYGIMSGAGVLYYVFALIVFAVASLFIVSIATLVAPIFTKLRAFFSKRPIFILILSVVFLGAVFFLYSRLLSVISELLIGNSLKFIFNRQTAHAIKEAVQYVVYFRQMGEFLDGNILSFIIVLAVTAALAVCAYFVSKLCYLAFLKSNTARRSAKIKNRKNKIRGVRSSLIHKELIEVFRSPQYMFSYFSVLLVLPALCYMTTGVLAQLMDKLLGGDFVPPFAVLICVMFSCVCNTCAGDVISREENRIMIVKTIPVPYKKQVGTKVGIALVIALISDLLMIATLLITKTLGLVDGLLVLAITVAATFASIMHLVAKDIKNPIVSSGGENSNVALMVVRALVFSCVLGGICFVLHGANVFLRGVDNPVLKVIVSIAQALGGVDGILLALLGICLIDVIFAVIRLYSRLDVRMRRIRI